MLIVICGTGPDQYLPERKLADTSWDATVKDIADGQVSEVSAVICSATGADVLPSIAKLVMTRWALRGEGLSSSERDFIEQNVSIQAANRFAMETV